MPCSYTGSCLGEFIGQNCIFPVLLSTAILPFVRRLFSFTYRREALFDPLPRVSFTPVCSDQALCDKFRVKRFFYSFSSDLRKP